MISQEQIVSALEDFRKRELCNLVLDKISAENEEYQKDLLSKRPEEIISRAVDICIRTDLTYGIVDYSCDVLAEEPELCEHLLTLSNILETMVLAVERSPIPLGYLVDPERAMEVLENEI